MSEAYNAVADNQGATEVSTSSDERPAWLPEGFNSGEELAARYAEMERTQHELGDRAQSAGDIPANQSDAAVIVESAGLDFSALSDEYLRYGTLSVESYADLARAGIGRDVVDSYIAGQNALVQDIKQSVFDAAGGADAYSDMVDWAKDALTMNEIDAYNASMNSGNTHQMRLAIDGLRSRFIADVGVTPQLVGGHSGHGSAGAGDTFASIKDMTAAMADDRYRTDATYRDAVIAKLGRSNII